MEREKRLLPAAPGRRNGVDDGAEFFAASGAPLSSAPRVHAPRSSSRASHTRHFGDGWDGQAQLGFSGEGVFKLQRAARRSERCSSLRR
jgi:hypothetical protein